jgi:hypothetical protein
MAGNAFTQILCMAGADGDLVATAQDGRLWFSDLASGAGLAGRAQQKVADQPVVGVLPGRVGGCILA